jgi:hypothetical protein
VYDLIFVVNILIFFVVTKSCFLTYVFPRTTQATVSSRTWPRRILLLQHILTDTSDAAVFQSLNQYKHAAAIIAVFVWDLQLVRRSRVSSAW